MSGRLVSSVPVESPEPIERLLLKTDLIKNIYHYTDAFPPYRKLPDSRSLAILRTLCYFDIFHYPLTAQEILQFAERSIAPLNMPALLEDLLDRGLIFRLGEYYSLQQDPALAERRKAGNERAVVQLRKAQTVGRFLYRFPFVSAVGISGSLSKQYAEPGCDFDFFIITRPGRLWIARTILHVYKKFSYLRGHQHWYCMNFFVDEAQLNLPDQNIFAAIECKTLLPVAGRSAMDAFFMANSWADEFLPMAHWRQAEQPDAPVGNLRRITESILDRLMPERLNRMLFRITTKRWMHKRRKALKNIKGVPLDLITSIHSARSNPGSFQEKVLAQYKQKVQETETAFIRSAEPVRIFSAAKG